jgi:YggT family protein
MLVAAAITRDDIAYYVETVIYVYVVILFLYLLINIVLSFGARPPYSRVFDVVMEFLRDVSEPYLRLFRRFIPSIGAIDLSPMIAIFVLVILDQVVTGLIRG